MNTETGELRRIAVCGAGPAFRDKQELRKIMEDGFVPVPEELIEEANEILGDKDSAFADMTKGSPLICWAKSEQSKKANIAKKKKMAKASRRRNRR